MRLALAPTLTVEIHSAASGFRLRISTSVRAYCVDRRVAFGVRMLRVVSGFVGWKGVQKHACRAIAGSRSSRSRGSGRPRRRSASTARRYTHAAQSRALAHREHTLDRERAYRPDRRAGTRMLHNRGLSLIVKIHWIASGLIDRRAREYTHAAQSRTHTHRGNTQDREWVYRSDMYGGTRMLHNRGLALTVEIHRASSVCNSGYPRPIRHC